MTTAAITAGRTVTVVTPENVTVTYQLAGAATRSMALLIDLVFQVLLLILLSLLVDLFRKVGFGIDHIVSFFGAIAGFCVLFVYNIFFEMVWGGRTPGKRLFNLRVIRDGGYPINLVASCIRNILRFIDFGIIPMATGSGGIVMYGAPGLLSVLLSSRYQRIGDFAAGTIVINELSAGTFTMSEMIPQTALGAWVKNLDRMTAEEFRIVRRFTSRRSKLELAVQAGVAENIARPLMAKLDMQIDVYYQTQYADILDAIEQRYIEENGIL